jgi:hypothetical protein
MDISKLKAAHEAELQEAGIKPGRLILPDKLDAAKDRYIKMVGSFMYYSELDAALEKGDVPDEAKCNISKAASAAMQRAYGAATILKTLGIKFDVDVKRGAEHEHS